MHSIHLRIAVVVKELSGSKTIISCNRDAR